MIPKTDFSFAGQTTLSFLMSPSLVSKFDVRLNDGDTDNAIMASLNLLFLLRWVEYDLNYDVKFAERIDYLGKLL